MIGFLRNGFLSCLLIVPAFAQNEVPEIVEIERVAESDGTWMPRQWSETGVNTCQRQWTCANIESVGLNDDEELSFTANATTDGTCTDDGEGACEACDLPEPVEVCHWTIVPIPVE